MIKIIYSLTNPQIVQQPLPERYLNQLPPEYLKRVFKLRRPEDRYNRLSGAVLLRYAAKEMGFSDTFLQEIQFDEFGRPFHSEKIDFNISHSNYCTVCIASNFNVGIDVELCNDIKLEEFRDGFNEEEWRYLKNGKEKNKLFFKLWTLKEAVLKADGRGLSYPLEQVNVLDKPVIIDQIPYYVTEFNIENNYVGTVAKSGSPALITVKKLLLWA